jgi:ribonucleases P/MRP protein subunit RPP40
MEKLIRNALFQHSTYLGKSYYQIISTVSYKDIQLLQVIDKWTKILDEGGSVYVIYLDLAKAFDTVPHQKLLNKLSEYGVGGRILEWIRQFLTGSKQKVRVRQAVSAWSEMLSGVPQGSVLGPVLFVCYINDLPDIVNSFIHMYAYYTKLFRRVDNDEDREELLRDLDLVGGWADMWQLRFNVEKCKTMHLDGRIKQ